MAQGLHKSKATKIGSNTKKTTGVHKRNNTGLGPKKGARVIAPKKRVLLQQQKINKVRTRIFL